MKSSLIFYLLYVIKLKDILKEGFDDEMPNKKAYSWLKPDGTFIPVKYSHGSDAHNIRFRSFPNKNDFDPKDDHILELWKLGWQRITNSNWMKSIYSHNEKMPPNSRQLKSLKDLAIELNADKVEWDSGNNEKVLWSSHDALQEKA